MPSQAAGFSPSVPWPRSQREGDDQLAATRLALIGSATGPIAVRPQRSQPLQLLVREPGLLRGARPAVLERPQHERRGVGGTVIRCGRQPGVCPSLLSRGRRHHRQDLQAVAVAGADAHRGRRGRCADRAGAGGRAALLLIVYDHDTAVGPFRRATRAQLCRRTGGAIPSAGVDLAERRPADLPPPSSRASNRASATS